MDGQTNGARHCSGTRETYIRCGKDLRSLLVRQLWRLRYLSVCSGLSWLLIACGGSSHPKPASLKAPARR
jgi:hypothetical protein